MKMKRRSDLLFNCFTTKFPGNFYNYHYTHLSQRSSLGVENNFRNHRLRTEGYPDLVVHLLMRDKQLSNLTRALRISGYLRLVGESRLEELNHFGIRFALEESFHIVQYLFPFGRLKRCLSLCAFRIGLVG